MDEQKIKVIHRPLPFYCVSCMVKTSIICGWQEVNMHDIHFIFRAFVLPCMVIEFYAAAFIVYTLRVKMVI